MPFWDDFTEPKSRTSSRSQIHSKTSVCSNVKASCICGQLGSVQLSYQRTRRKLIPWKKSHKPGLPKGEPIVALFDGLPLTGHREISDRLIVDDPDGYEDAYQANERVHGTHMASLISRGDLNEQCSAIKHPLYSRPIMQLNAITTDSL